MSNQSYSGNSTSNLLDEYVSILLDHNHLFYACIALLIYAIRLSYSYHSLHHIVPESVAFIAVGVITSWIMMASGDAYRDHMHKLKLTHFTFFTVMLPPIILDAAYNLYHPVFLHNVGTICVFALLGTLINFLMIGILAWLMMRAISHMPELGILDSYLFSAIIVAVDPVAVIQTFEELQVDVHLYFLVSGEAMLNDAMTVSLYKVMVYFVETGLHGALKWAEELGKAVVGTVVSTILAGVIGCLLGLLSSLIAKRTLDTPRYEPAIMISLAFLSYVLAEITNLSGIVSLIACGIIMAAYTKCNISDDSKRTFSIIVHMVASLCEIVIFLSMGVELALMTVEVKKQKIYASFTVIILILCLVGRAITTVAISAVMNVFRTRRLTSSDQAISFYAGLRGAVALSLAMTIDNVYPTEDKAVMVFNFKITTLLVVMVMNVLLGPLTKYIVKRLGIRLEKQKISEAPLFMMINQVCATQLHHSLAFIVGKGRWRLVWQEFESTVLCPTLISFPQLRNKVINAFLYESFARARALDSKRIFFARQHDLRLAEESVVSKKSSVASTKTSSGQRRASELESEFGSQFGSEFGSQFEAADQQETLVEWQQ